MLVEAKSGYGLDTANEMKMLRVLERAKQELPIDISSTYCGAHAVPRGLTASQALENILTEQLPELRRLQSAGEVNVDSIDVFCEKGVFDVEQSRQILEAGRLSGLRLNLHADELSPLGGAEVYILLFCIDTFLYKNSDTASYIFFRRCIIKLIELVIIVLFDKVTILHCLRIEPILTYIQVSVL